MGPRGQRCYFRGLVNFNPPTPCGVGLKDRREELRLSQISIHPPRAGWDSLTNSAMSAQTRFQSTHPVRGGTNGLRVLPHPSYNFNPPTPCGVGLDQCRALGVSKYFNPPTPCGVGPRVFCVVAVTAEFQSTHPVRGGTESATVSQLHIQDFNPPTPCGVGPVPDTPGVCKFEISIHPPRAGWDLTTREVIKVIKISIHPPRAGWDSRIWTNGGNGSNFNPPTPCGVGPYCVTPYTGSSRFQSTHPVRGGTRSYDQRQRGSGNFNPPTPCGVGPESAREDFISTLFQSTHPVRGGTASCPAHTTTSHDFNPPTPCGVGQSVLTLHVSETMISIHPPRAGWDSKNTQDFSCYSCKTVAFYKKATAL